MRENGKKLLPASKAMLRISAIGLVLVLFVPMWRIELDAPQYPEGLVLQIFPNKIGGDVEIVNGLNHYIGMKTLHTADFIEFTILPYAVALFALLSIVVVFLNKVKWLNVLLILFISFGVIAMYDFWRWEYDYGHDLDPNAAILIPGMAYQPPLIGFKQLLNFGAYSIPDTGGWIFIGTGVLILFAVILEWRKKKQQRIIPLRSPLTLFIPIILIASCTNGPEPILVGKDHCEFCKMTVADPRFAAEIVTAKGRVFKFDDLSCAIQFYKEKEAEQTGFGEMYVTNYRHPDQLLPAKSCFYFASQDLKSPMNGNIAAFTNKSEKELALGDMIGDDLQWSDIIQ